MGRRVKFKGPSPYVEKLMGLYDGDAVRLSIRRDLLSSDKSLYRFFGEFSRHKDIEDFGVTDVDWFVKRREAAGAEPTEIATDLENVRAFWNYLIDYHGFNCVNPASRREMSDWTKARLANPKNYLESQREFHRAAQRLFERF
jgi:hypothetical protein